MTFQPRNFFSTVKKSFSIHFSSKYELFSLEQNHLSRQKIFCLCRWTRHNSNPPKKMLTSVYVYESLRENSSPWSCHELFLAAKTHDYKKTLCLDVLQDKWKFDVAEVAALYVTRQLSQKFDKLPLLKLDQIFFYFPILSVRRVPTYLNLNVAGL